MEIIKIAQLSYKKVHGPYTRENGRQIVIVIDHDGSRRTVSYPKWLLEMQLRRKLNPDLETVDHIDSDFTNNNLDNLQILDRQTHSEQDTRRVKLVDLECCLCKKHFERSPRVIRDKAKNNKAGPFCSRSCAGKYSRLLQLKLIDKFDVQEAVDSEYYKKKYVSASLKFDPSLFLDYFCNIFED